MPPDILEIIQTYNPFVESIGVQFTKCAGGECISQLELKPVHHHGGGVVHGGVAFTMADSAMATGLMSALEPGKTCATIESKISYLAPAVSGLMTCESRVIRLGRSVAFTEAKVYCDGKLVATARGTFAIIEFKKNP